MGGLLGFLVTSAIGAVVGTAVRGLLRPVSWALFAVAASLLVSNQLLNARGAVDVAQNPDTTSSPTVSPTTTITPTTSDRPIAQEGWQEVADDLAPVVNRALSEFPNPPSASPRATPTPTQSPASESPSGSRSPSPIPGFW